MNKFDDSDIIRPFHKNLFAFSLVENSVIGKTTILVHRFTAKEILIDLTKTKKILNVLKMKREISQIITSIDEQQIFTDYNLISDKLKFSATTFLILENSVYETQRSLNNCWHISKEKNDLNKLAFYLDRLQKRLDILRNLFN